MFDQPFVKPCPVQAIDPRVRVLAAVILSVGLALLQTPAACGWGLALGALSLTLSRPPLMPFLRRLAAINAFVLFLWCVTPWTVAGTPLLHWGWLTASREGVHLCLLATLKANAVFCVFLSLAASMDMPALGQALSHLGCPDKLAYLFLFSSRFVHDLAGEWHTLHTAAKLRGFRIATTRHTYYTLASLLGLLLIRAHARSLRVHEAMRLRGFTGTFRCVAPFALSWRDALFAAGVVASLAALTWLELSGGAHV